MEIDFVCFFELKGLKTFVDENEENLFFQENPFNEEKGNLLANLIEQSKNNSKPMKKSLENINQLNQIRNHLNEQV